MFPPIIWPKQHHLLDQGSSYAGRWQAGPPGTLTFHQALKLILSLNTQHSSLKSCKIDEESVLKGKLLSEFQFS